MFTRRIKWRWRNRLCNGHPVNCFKWFAQWHSRRKDWREGCICLWCFSTLNGITWSSIWRIICCMQIKWNLKWKGRIIHSAQVAVTLWRCHSWLPDLNLPCVLSVCNVQTVGRWLHVYSWSLLQCGCGWHPFAAFLRPSLSMLWD